MYKIADGSIPVRESVNEAFNKLWDDRELTMEDLNNIYNLINIVQTGKLKEKQYKIRKHRIAGGK